MKKRKLNSRNPKYRPKTTKIVENKRQELMCNVKGVKIYATFTN